MSSIAKRKNSPAGHFAVPYHHPARPCDTSVKLP
jgi:hypothetical protein